MSPRLLFPSFAALAALAALLGCGSTVINVTSTSSSAGASAGASGAGGSASASSAGAGAGSSASSASASTGSGPPASPCPPTQPTGEPCTAPEGFTCTYGDSVRADCRGVSICQGGQWMSTGTACSESTICSSFSTPPQGKVCTGNEGDFCAIGNTLCGCSQCIEGPCMVPPVEWQCSGPPSTPGCPAVAPNDGTACTQANLNCIYGFVCGGSGANVTCTAGTWLWNMMVACPG